MGNRPVALRVKLRIKKRVRLIQNLSRRKAVKPQKPVRLIQPVLPQKRRANLFLGKKLPGAMLGGLVIGIVQSGANTYISSSMSDTFVYLILIVVLMLRPAGILGKNVGEKV